MDKKIEEYKGWNMRGTFCGSYENNNVNKFQISKTFQTGGGANSSKQYRLDNKELDVLNIEEKKKWDAL